MRFLSLFAGIGGFDLGLERAGWKCVGQVEIDPYCRAVLAKHWPDVPRMEDVRDVQGHEFGPVDAVVGGFPCQDISSAGRKAGIGGEKSGLWLEFFRIIRVVRPRHIVVENVSALTSRGLGDVLGHLAEIGYDAEWNCIQVAHLGAPHLRDRAFIYGYPNSYGESEMPEHDETSRMPRIYAHAKRWLESLGLDVARTGGNGKRAARWTPWGAEDSPLGMGVDDGVPSRLDRLRALGNAVCPQVAEAVGRAINAADGSMA